MKVQYAPTQHIIPADDFAAYSRNTGPDAWQAIYLAADVDARIAELEKALRHVLTASGGQCENYTSGIGSCLRNSRTPDAKYGADRCCWSCLAHSVL